jgi:hypothetical protein
MYWSILAVITRMWIYMYLKLKNMCIKYMYLILSKYVIKISRYL